ncbi:hypothetical protein ACRALDRAFT_1078543 [Sodiomyces alcalophilus JCM 7366]|uniref:uncharacterized protein n=1 Tax=Sodiomyces alcalophilus JCM 7366 TaxID=591952 RepID=UPI0039B40F31
MVRLSALAAGVVPICLAAAVPARRQSSNACAQLAQTYEAAASDFFDVLPIVKPSVAYECLRSIPLDVERDQGLLDFLGPWLEFQSTVGILADPPPGYMFPGVDILGGLRNMSSMVENGDYENQYDFVTDLYRLLNVKPREGHLSYTPALAIIVEFSTPARFISISKDGTSLPSVYLLSDYLESMQSGYTASSVESFDGTPITDWLQQRAVDNDKCQDPDAAYNSQLWSAALDNIGISLVSNVFYHGTLPDESVIELTNGTEVTVENQAFLIGDFSSIESGEDVHNEFEVPGFDGRARGSLYDPRDYQILDLDGYPEPFARHSEDYLTGYAFERGRLYDTAVLAVKSFMSPLGEQSTQSDIEEFEQVCLRFTRAAKVRGANRLILDFQGNGGGALGSLLAMYIALFPQARIHLPMRARANPLLEWMGKTAEQTGENMMTAFDINLSVDDDLQSFRDWADFYELETILGDQFTEVYQPSIMASLTRLVQQGDYIEWFKPEDTVIITDGFCASACALAVGLMSRLLGVQVIAMGGRPIEAPMQAIGGTKGGPVIGMREPTFVYDVLSDMVEPPADLDATPFEMGWPPLAGPHPESVVINSANVHLDEEGLGTPAQFVYEAANCKLFYTWETLSNMTALWAAAADVKWNGAPCVKGSTTNDDDTMGDDVLPFTQDVVSKFTWAAGPGDVSDKPPAGTPEDNSGGGGGSGSGGGGGDGDGDGNGGSGGDNNAASRIGGVVMAIVMSVFTATFLA